MVFHAKLEKLLIGEHLPLPLLPFEKKNKKVWLKRAVNIKGLPSINKKGLTIPFVFTNSSVAISQPCVTVLLFHMAAGEDLNSAWVAGLSLIHLSGTLCNIKDLSSQKCVAELKS